MPARFDSYQREIAENSLRKFGVPVSDPLVQKQLEDPSSFMRTLIKLHAHFLKNDLVLRQVDDMLAYSQNRLSNIVFANFSSAMKQGITEEAEEETAPQKSLAALQHDFEQEAASVIQFKENFAKRTNEINSFIRAQLQDWKKSSSDSSATTRLQSEISSKISGLASDLTLYQEHLANIIFYDERTTGFLSQYPDKQREKELASQNQLEKPEIEPVFVESVKR